MSNKHLIVSVESRKGGVGKTTAALVLAKIYLERKYQVLFLDLDLTGTNVIDSIQSPFWCNTCSILQAGEKQNVDVIDLFLDKFMSGRTAIQFTTTKKENGEFFYLEKDKINIIGSELINPEKIKPTILFDELHSFWFVEFLQHIERSFIKAFNHSNTVIILDNSPGYIGFVSKIHDWLTDLGPDNGKFIIVSSLDSQDIISCCSHIEELHHLLLTKYTISKKMQNEKENPNLTEKEIGFYLRLIENKDLLEFYYQNNKKPIIPQSYLALVINKTLNEIFSGTLSYDFSFLNKAITKYHDGYFNEILKKDRKEDFFYEKMIPYDENIEYQFLINRLNVPRNNIRKLDSAIDIEMKQMIETIKKHPEATDTRHFWNSEGFSGIISLLNEYQSLFNQNLLKIEAAGFTYIGKVFKPIWQPRGISVQIEKRIDIIMRTTNYNQERFIHTRFNDVSINKLSFDLLHETSSAFINRLKVKNEIPSSILYRLVNSLLIVLYLSGSVFNYSEKDSYGIRNIFYHFVSSQIRHWKRIKDKRTRLTKFLAAEKSLDESDFLELDPALKSDKNMISHFYCEVSKAQARIIDLQKDFEFLITVLYRVINQKEREFYIPNIRGLLNNVIISKKISHEEGEKLIFEELNRMDHLDQFEEILKKQITQW